MEVRDDALAAEIERILESNTFRNSEALRRLLRFLAEKRLSGEADQLKEYSVGIDALGKPPSYDPRQDSTVRIQVGRLRNKLAEYYRTEGKQDPLIVDLPKGHFKLRYEEIPPPAAPPAAAVSEAPLPTAAVVPPPQVRSKPLTPVVLGLSLALVLSVTWAVIVTAQLSRTRERASGYTALWTPEIEQLWKPFLTSRRPLIISIADPPFAQFKGYGAYRDLTLNTWEDILKSPAVLSMRKALNNAEVQPNHYYTPIGEVNASFLVGKLLGPRVETLSLLRTSDLSFEQLANNNVLFIGAAVFFQNQLQGLPVQLDLVNLRPGIHNLHPRKGEPAIFEDRVPTGTSEDGEAYILVTHIPGPLGTTDIETFTSNRTPGRLAAVDWFTDPNHARILWNKLRSPSGQVPRYYQIVLNVKYKAGVPTETSYVLHREVHVTGNP
ncbi:MAG: hypothetical protein JO323_26450 [Acidobacteriia bacterium]|nr:hypothetical protein [Terriglobia bacterium]